jgi:penicillin-binding protein 1C
MDRIVSERTAFWIADILSDPDARAYIFGRGGSLEFPFTVAAKTGTSQAYHDNWAIGFTADLTVGVWVGNFDRTPLRQSSGVTGAGPIFHDVMMAAVEYTRGRLPIGEHAPLMSPTPDVRRTEVCVVSGMAPHEGCRTRTTEWLPAEASPERCTWHHVHDGEVITVWPEPYRQWARAEGLDVRSVNVRRADLQVANARHADPQVGDSRGNVRSADRQVGEDRATLSISSPLAGALYLSDPTLRPEFQRLPLRASGAASSTLEWFVDDRPIGKAHRDEPMWWPLAKGTHTIAVRDAGGRSASTHIVVR